MLNACACRWERKKPPVLHPSFHHEQVLLSVLCSALLCSPFVVSIFARTSFGPINSGPAVCLYASAVCLVDCVVLLLLSLCVSLFQTNKY